MTKVDLSVLDELEVRLGFTKEILDSFPERSPWRNKLSHILNRLQQSGFRNHDIEAVMDVLTTRQDANKARLSIGPRIIEFAQGTNDRSEDTSVKELLR